MIREQWVLIDVMTNKIVDLNGRKHNLLQNSFPSMSKEERTSYRQGDIIKRTTIHKIPGYINSKPTENLFEETITYKYKLDKKLFKNT